MSSVRSTTFTGPPEMIRIPGPMRARVVVEARNVTRRIGGEEEAQHAPLYGYTIDVPPGHVWELSAVLPSEVRELLGSNGGVRVIVEEPPRLGELVPPVLALRDLPCDLGVTELDDGACTVPRPCDPIPPGAMIAMPPDMPAMVTVPARGGLVRTRFFDGLFMTRADLETEQRRLRTEQALQNRAQGAGVVWGLVPTFDGQAITISLGYGVDCCGNDLIVTTPYSVGADALAGDPLAALPPRGEARRHLLLEYVEVPEAHRPVHDECGPGIARTEPSRVRETVRLRLVPPRDFSGRGPIDDLLATGVLTGDDADPAIDVPFIPRFTFLDGNGGVVIQFTFPIDLDGEVFEVDVRNAVGADIETATKPGWTMLAARVFQENEDDPTHPDQIGGLDPQTGVIRWELGPPSTQITRFWIDWEARHGNARGRLIGTTPMSSGADIDRQSVVTIRADASSVRFELDPPGPCDREPCAPGGPDPTAAAHRGLFPTDPPWIHPFPSSPAAADPRVIDLALSELGLGDEVDMDGATRNAVRDLLAAWCDSLLWRGPSCHGPLPQGVVVGCARIVNGAIAGIEAWGGRRWVMRPPLVNHIAAEVGITPPDLLVSRLAALACCAAGQPPPAAPGPIGRPRGEPAPDELRRRVDRLLARRPAPLPPLLRPFAGRLAANLVRATPVDALSGVEEPLAERLRAAGATNAGALLVIDPEALLARVGAEHATALSRAIAAAEELASRATAGVADELSASTTGERPPASRRDLDDDPTRSRLLERLERRLSTAARMPRDRLEAAMAEALR